MIKLYRFTSGSAFVRTTVVVVGQEMVVVAVVVVGQEVVVAAV